MSFENDSVNPVDLMSLFRFSSSVVPRVAMGTDGPFLELYEGSAYRPNEFDPRPSVLKMDLTYAFGTFLERNDDVAAYNIE